MATAPQVYPGIVPASKARKHIHNLRAVGIGRRSIADACDVSDNVIAAIATGRRNVVRRTTEERILSVDRQALSDGCLVPSEMTLHRIEALLDEGLSKSSIRRLIGIPGLRRRLRLRAVTALRVEQLYNATTH